MKQEVLHNSILEMELQEKVCMAKEFDYIFETYYKRIFNYVYYRVYCRFTTEDLTSQVFEKAIRKIDTYTQSKAPFEVWLFAIARNVVNDYFRVKKKQWKWRKRYEHDEYKGSLFKGDGGLFLWR